MTIIEYRSDSTVRGVILRMQRKHSKEELARQVAHCIHVFWQEGKTDAEKLEQIQQRLLGLL